MRPDKKDGSSTARGGGAQDRPKTATSHPHAGRQQLQGTPLGRDGAADGKEQREAWWRGWGGAAAGADDGKSGKKKAAAKGANEFKTMTSGHTAILEWMDENGEGNGEEGDENSTPRHGLYAKQKVDEAPKAMGNTWTPTKWLEEVENLEGCLAEAICLDEEGDVLQDLDALEHVRAIESRDELLERLRNGGALETLCDAIWPKLEVLKAGPATASELAAQWFAQGAGQLLYGGLPSFFQGLEPRIGSP